MPVDGGGVVLVQQELVVHDRQVGVGRGGRGGGEEQRGDRDQASEQHQEGQLTKARQVALQTVEPSDDQMSTFVRTRAITSSVNSDVVAWPPRSGVRTPVAVASSTDS